MPFTCFFISSSLFATIQIKVLQQQLKTLSEYSSDIARMDERLNLLIRTQQNIIKYVKELENLVAYCCLAEWLPFGIMIVILLFFLSTVREHIINFFKKFTKKNILGPCWFRSIFHRIQLFVLDFVTITTLVLALE